MSFPVHPFWDFSLGLYGKPGVADACLFVQDRYGMNVNLILFCIWFADNGGGSLTGENISTALLRIADWQGQVIKPLREIRRTSRHEALGVPEFLLDIFQPQIDAVELEAEHIEQLILAEFARGLESSSEGAEDPASAAVASLQRYVAKLDVARDAQLAECMSSILHAAFADARFPAAADPLAN